MGKGTAVATGGENLPVSTEQLKQWQEDAGQGLEGIGAKDIAIPFLGHVQALSKQLEEGHPKFLPEARVGSIFNTVTGEVFSAKEGVVVVPVEIKKVVVEKEPKKAGGGGGKIVGMYATRADAQAAALPGNELLDGYRVIVLYQAKNAAWSPAAVSFGTKSKIYAMRNWNALMSGLRVDGPGGEKIRPPIFAWTYHITSAQMEFDAGTSAVFVIKAAGPASDEAYAQAKDLRNALAEGMVKLGKDEDVKADDEKNDDLPF